MKVYIKTYGCQMNEYDSNLIRDISNKMKLQEVDSYTDADLVIINTCNIREKASEKLYSELGRISRHKMKQSAEHGRYIVIVIIGCVAQADGELIFKRSPLVDIVIGPQGYHKFQSMVESAFSGYNTEQQRKHQIMLDFVADDKFDFLDGERSSAVSQKGKPSAFVTVQEGCDRFCTFCVVPYTRGPEVSRPVKQIIDEVRFLADHGTKDVMLLGQNVNAYHGLDGKGNTWNLAQLISEVALIDGISRIRYTTSHPSYMNKDLIAVHGGEEKLSPILNLPVQSGSNSILKSMNRRHTVEEYIDIIQSLRKMRSDLVVSSDFIIGFPGETDADFQSTLSFVNNVVFSAQSFAFKYSIRPGTPAASMQQVDENVKVDRLGELQDLLETQRDSFNRSLENKVVLVLFDKLNMRESDQLGGRTEFNQIAIVRNLSEQQKNTMFGKILPAIVTKVNPNSFDCALL